MITMGKLEDALLQSGGQAKSSRETQRLFILGDVFMRICEKKFNGVFSSAFQKNFFCFLF